MGDSDHSGIVTQKVTRSPPDKPKSIRTRSYKKTDIQLMLKELSDANINNLVVQCDTLVQAVKIFNREVLYVLDNSGRPKSVYTEVM